ncbi:hypothetical protein RJ639_033589 [Escallonia herrerae]|uniref:Pop1 N-terminal domain-containing protein n=1 Tax=Escallonia herrerae TaxID=1293975 RepID=A0AA89B960_9ASTE|nr:hypothetical protein RJ639_033589 [Escallonia herrerae]
MTVEGSKQPRVSAAPPPRTLNVQKFAESRASELETLHSVVGNRLDNDFRSRRNKRRRTASHDNRVTKNKSRKKQKVGVVDSSKKDTLKNDGKKIPRYVCRKNEFKKNPASGFSTSGDGTKRLRTHMWHAKRFTMTKLWGFHLPLGLQGRGKGSRALLKWVKQEAVVHDASYSSAVQLEGSEAGISLLLCGSLLSILKAVLVPSASVHSEDICHNVLFGVICASAMLHHFEASPSRAIAPVTYMWRPLQERGARLDAAGHNTDGRDGPRNIDSCSSTRRVWIWIHASAFREGYEVSYANLVLSLPHSKPVILSEIRLVYIGHIDRPDLKFNF